MLRIVTPSARTRIPFLRRSAPSSTTAFRSAPTIVMSCFSRGTTFPPGYVPALRTILSPGCACAMASCSVGTSPGTAMSEPARADEDVAPRVATTSENNSRRPRTDLVQHEARIGSFTADPCRRHRPRCCLCAVRLGACRNAVIPAGQGREWPLAVQTGRAPISTMSHFGPSKRT
jgi:hypothetical protein